MRRTAIASAAGLALADASIVALALPRILLELDTTVEGVAAVIAVYTAVLALALLPADWLRRQLGARVLGAGGLVLFAAASVGCGLVDSLTPLLVLRAVQALGGAAALVAAFDALDGAGSGRRTWVAAAVFGTAAGPALGGALTELFEWRAIFLVQAPVGLAGAVAFLAGAEVTPHTGPREWRRLRYAAALGLVAGALTAVLFLLVVLLVAGFGVSPAVGAATVSVLPLTALAAARIHGDPHARACAGAILLAAGTAALAFLPGASPLWAVPPLALAGIGMGLALPALAGELIPERGAAEAARLLTLRHAGIAIALVVLAPIASADLDDAIERAQLRGTAVVLDASLDPQDKIGLAPTLLGGLETDDPRRALERSIRRERRAVDDPEDSRELRRIEGRLDDTVVVAVGDAFEAVFLLTAALSLVAAALLMTGRPWLLALLAVVVLMPAGYFGLQRAFGPERVTLADPCGDRDLPGSGGLGGIAQDAALVALDEAACRFGSSREELVLALADDEAAESYEERHGVNPRSIESLIGEFLP